MADLLNAFNVGDIDRYHELVSTHKAKLEEVVCIHSIRLRSQSVNSRVTHTRHEAFI